MCIRDRIRDRYDMLEHKKRERYIKMFNRKLERARQKISNAKIRSETVNALRNEFLSAEMLNANNFRTYTCSFLKFFRYILVNCKIEDAPPNLSKDDFKKYREFFVISTSLKRLSRILKKVLKYTKENPTRDELSRFEFQINEFVRKLDREKRTADLKVSIPLPPPPTFSSSQSLLPPTPTLTPSSSFKAKDNVEPSLKESLKIKLPIFDRSTSSETGIKIPASIAHGSRETNKFIRKPSKIGKPLPKIMKEKQTVRDIPRLPPKIEKYLELMREKRASQIDEEKIRKRISESWAPSAEQMKNESARTELPAKKEEDSYMIEERKPGAHDEDDIFHDDLVPAATSSAANISFSLKSSKEGPVRRNQPQRNNAFHIEEEEEENEEDEGTKIMKEKSSSSGDRIVIVSESNRERELDRYKPGPGMSSFLCYNINHDVFVEIPRELSLNRHPERMIIEAISFYNLFDKFDDTFKAKYNTLVKDIEQRQANSRSKNAIISIKERIVRNSTVPEELKYEMKTQKLAKVKVRFIFGINASGEDGDRCKSVKVHIKNRLSIPTFEEFTCLKENKIKRETYLSEYGSFIPYNALKMKVIKNQVNDGMLNLVMKLDRFQKYQPSASYCLLTRLKPPIGPTGLVPGMENKETMVLDIWTTFEDIHDLSISIFDNQILQNSQVCKHCSHVFVVVVVSQRFFCCLLYTSPSPRDGLLSRMPSSA
eukprot:TRINITY_DN5925_c0_g1_i3.p1 TRINITY_DN5925_c0_g1~~TRINITY_DN5925_c0_g1_i3.p1  ORF type:complete len:712 (-),score=154.81 TRINITY_DN5925_c0_g1_i3:11-2146(-)